MTGPLSSVAEEAPPRTRDAERTRHALLEAARARFARDGYAGATVRDIAADAGVNVALINRYFTSKEGLFEACLARATEAFGRQDTPPTLDDIVQRMVGQLTGDSGSSDNIQLLLLLRSSGDSAADHIRRRVLQSYAEQIDAATEPPAIPDTSDTRLLHAELAIALGLGVALLRTSPGLEPLASATAEKLGPPLRSAMSALLDR